MNKLDLDYQTLLKDIIENGTIKETRNGNTISVFGRQIRHNMSEGFPLLTTKKMPFKTIVTELLWFLRGDTNIKYLVDNNCHIWDGDCYSNYCKQWDKYPSEGTFNSNEYSSLTEHEAVRFTQEEFINKIKTDDEFTIRYGDLGPIYGKQWRNWNGRKTDGFIEYESNGYSEHIKGIDQITNLINDLKTNPDSRRLMVNAWNVGELDQMVLPPCHYGFQVYTRELNRLERIELGIKAGWFPKGYVLNFKHEDLEGWNIPTRAISLMWNQRSVDTFLGLPFNIASYGLLLEIIAKAVNMVPEELIGNLGDVHLYSNHIEQAKEQIGGDLADEERYNIWFANNYETGMEKFFDPNKLPEFDNEYYEPTPKRTREPFLLPTLKIREGIIEYGNEDVDPIPWYSSSDFILENYQSHSTIKAPLSN